MGPVRRQSSTCWLLLGICLSFIGGEEMAAAGRVIVYGGKGALGSAIVKLFRSNSWVCVILPQIVVYRFVGEFFLSCISMVRGVANCQATGGEDQRVEVNRIACHSCVGG